MIENKVTEFLIHKPLLFSDDHHYLVSTSVVDGSLYVVNIIMHRVKFGFLLIPYKTRVINKVMEQFF